MPRQTCRTVSGAKPANNIYGNSNKSKNVVFTDSEDEAEENNLLGNMPMPTSATVVKQSLSASTSSVSSTQHGHHHRGQGQGHFMHSHSQASHAHQTHRQQLSCSSEQSQHNQSSQALQRKKQLNTSGGCSSAMSMSSSASALGGRKAAPLSPLAGHVLSSQSQASGVGLNNEFEEDYSSGAHVNQMLSKLGADLQLRVRAKRQRLDEYFKNVKAAPGVTLASRQRHIEQRNKLAEELRADTVKLGERLDNVIQVQATNQDKHAKMMVSLTRGSEQIRAAICECAKAQTSLYEKFALELKKLEDQQDETTKELMERCESTVFDLQNKIASEQMKSETESLFKLKFI